MKISILTNNKRSWFWNYNGLFKKKLITLGHDVLLLSDNEELRLGGDICFFLACTNLVPEEFLKYHRHNLVIHHSDLPKGRGSCPIVWQILEGKSRIPFSMIEAVKEVDAGIIYMKEYLELEGHELLEEIFEKRWTLEQKMILNIIEQYPNLQGVKQEGKPTEYRRRNFKDDELSVERPLSELFNQFRIADNDKWPGYFFLNGHKYYLKIYKAEDQPFQGITKKKTTK